MSKKILSILLTLTILIGVIAVIPISVSAQEKEIADIGADVDIQTSASINFSPRYEAPAYDNPYYTSMNIYYTSGYGMPNCTCYAWGRVYEASGSYPNLPNGNANAWFNNAPCDKGYTPRPGAVICGNAYSYGHVAFVEKVYDDGVHFDISESHYGGAYFDVREYITSSDFPGYQGFLYPFDGGSGIDFTPVDIGTDFYGSIVNLAVNKPIKVSGGNVVCGVRNGSNEQKWRFERQGDLSYKIVNVANGECLDDDNYGNTDNTNIKTCGSNDTDAQRWFFRNNGSGYSLVPKCSQNLAMDLVDGNSTEGNNIAAWTYVENNGNQIYGIDHQPSFSPVDIGTNFYGSIVNLAANKPIKVSNNNVVMGVRNGSDEQKWKFERMDDRMYKITNVATGKCLDDDNYGTTDDTNIKVVGSNNEPAQRWYFRKNGSGYSLVPKCAQNLAMDMVGGNSSEGNNVAAWTFVENNGNQVFGIDIQPSFTPQDLGDRFTVNIIHSTSGSVVTENRENNVVIQKFSGSDSQKWLFDRMDDRMYKITNVASGRVLDIDNGGTTDDTNIQTWASLDNLHQRWYLLKNGSGYSLVPKCSLNLSMDLVGGKTEDGSNLAAWTSVSGNGNQIYTLELKVIEPTTPTEQPTTPNVPTEQKTVILGDADGDEDVSSVDVTLIQRYCADFMINVPEETLMHGDVDGSGDLEILDATLIQRFLADFTVQYSIGECIKQ